MRGRSKVDVHCLTDGVRASAEESDGHEFGVRAPCLAGWACMQQQEWGLGGLAAARQQLLGLRMRVLPLLPLLGEEVMLMGVGCCGCSAGS